MQLMFRTKQRLLTLFESTGMWTKCRVTSVHAGSYRKEPAFTTTLKNLFESSVRSWPDNDGCNLLAFREINRRINHLQLVA